MRNLVTIETILKLEPISGADRIEVATVKGWQVVVKKDEFKVGDVAVYFEVDSWIPKILAPFLCSDKPKYFYGMEGALLKTVKIRKQLSQGLLLHTDYVNQYLLEHPDKFNLDLSLQDRLEVSKYEAPETDIGKSFPHFIPKTDQDRLQNLDLKSLLGFYEVTEKLDGSSMTIFNHGDLDGVCSRSVWLKDDGKTTFSTVGRELNIIDKLDALKLNLAIQGELIGPGIQGNPYKLDSPQFYCYSIFDIDKQEYLLPVDRYKLCDDLNIPHVPVLSNYNLRFTDTVEDLLLYAENQSLINKSVSREGLVFKNLCDQTSFKVISNAWLLKG